MSSLKDKVRLQTAENERMLHPIGPSFFSTLIGRVRQRVLRTSTDRVTRNSDSSNIPRSFV